MIKLGHTATKTSLYQVASEKYAELIPRATDGPYVIEVYPSDLLGTKNQAVGGIIL